MGRTEGNSSKKYGEEKDEGQMEDWHQEMVEQRVRKSEKEGEETVYALEK